MILSGPPGSGMFRIMPQPVIYFAAGAQAGDIVIETVRGPWPKHG